MSPNPGIPTGAHGAEQFGIPPDFAAEVRAALAQPSAALFIPKSSRELIQRMADHIQDLTQRENELRLRVIALEDSAHV